MVSVVVLDAYRQLRGAFESWYLSRRNHKVNSVKKYQQFLNKTQAIAGQYGVSHNVIIQNSKTSQYAWNSAPIYDTNVMSSVVSVGREFRFPLDT